MATTKVAVTIDTDLLAQVDQLVAQHVFPNRSKAIQAALQDKLTRMRRGRLARESAKLDPQLEQALAEAGMDQELAAWPEYYEAKSGGPT
jgi:Arc/MetJ-type ribon-helix-helix transcriptional regulator